MKQSVTKTFRFDAAHRLSFHKGKCRNLHGHSYRLDVTLEGFPDENGILMDFHDLKTIVHEKIVNVLDHATMICKDDDLLMSAFPKKLNHVILDCETTAENLCRWIDNELKNAGLDCKRIDLWETPTSKASLIK